MPELSRFYNIVIKMLFSDNDKHHNRKCRQIVVYTAVQNHNKRDDLRRSRQRKENHENTR